MYGKVNFGEKEVELKATALTPVLFRRIFKFDLLNTLAKMRNIETLDEWSQIEEGLNAHELFTKLGFVMAMQGGKADYSKITIEDYYNWLDEFETNSIAVDEIIKIYHGNTATTTDSKNL